MLHDILRNKFGFENFKPGQQEIIESIMSQQHTLGILPVEVERVCVIKYLRIYQVSRH